MGKTYSLSSCWDRITTRLSGYCLWISWVASSPPRPGMAISISTMSGESSRTLLMASRPSPASPTTSMSGESFKSARIPSLRMAWSSTMRTLILSIPRTLQRHLDPQLGARAGRRFHREGSPEEGDPLLHAHEPKPPALVRGLGHRRQVEALAVVLHLYDNLRLGYLQAHHHVLGLGVAGYVGYRLLGHPEQGRLHFRGQAALYARRLHLHLHPLGLQPVLGVPADGRHQPQVVQDGGAQVQDQLPHLLQHPDGHGLDGFDPGLHLFSVGGGGHGGGLQGQPQGGQGLAGVVVELPGYALPLLLLGRDHLSQQLSPHLFLSGELLVSLQ